MSDITGVVQTEGKNPDGSSLISHHIKYENITPTKFVATKHTFHPSGIVHITDKTGKKKELGVKSIPFDKIQTFQLLALVAPHEPVTYPIIKEQDIKPDLDVVLDMGLFKNSPFQIEVYLVRGDKENVIKPPFEPGTIADVHCGGTETYTLLVRCRQRPELIGTPFPPQTLFGTVVVKEDALE